MLGVKITPEQVAALEKIIPQIPARAVEIIQFVNATAAQMDMRLKAVEELQQLTLRKLELLTVLIQDAQVTLDVLVVQTTTDDIVRTAGSGATGRLLEIHREQLPERLEESINEPSESGAGTARGGPNSGTT